MAFTWKFNIQEMMAIEFPKFKKPEKANPIETFVGLNYDQQLNAVNDFMDSICMELDIPLATLQVRPNLFGGSCYVSDRRLVILDPFQMMAYSMDPLTVLAHELRHAFQYDQGWLGNKDYYNFLWKSEEVSILGKKHHQLPWEKDAIKYERDMSDKLGYKRLPRPDMEAELREVWFEHIRQSA